MEFNYTYSWVVGQFETTANMLRTIPLHELSSYHMVDGVMNLITALEKTESLADVFVKEGLSEFGVLSQERWDELARCALVKIEGGAGGLSTAEINIKCYGGPVVEL